MSLYKEIIILEEAYGMRKAEEGAYKLKKFKDITVLKDQRFVNL